MIIFHKAILYLVLRCFLPLDGCLPGSAGGGMFFGLFPGMVNIFQEYTISLNGNQHICKKRRLKRFLTIYKYFLTSTEVQYFEDR